MLKKYLLLVSLFIWIGNTTFAQLVSDNLETFQVGNSVNLSSPYHTTLSFFYHLEEGNYQPEKAAKALDLSNFKDGNGESLAVKLKQIFEGKGMLIRTNEIPNEQNYFDSTSASNENIYYFDKKILPGIFLQKTGDTWKYSAFSVSQIDELHSETYPYGTAKLLNILPKIGNEEYLGLHLWQLIGLFTLLLLVFLSHWFFTLVVDRLILYLFQRFGYGKIGENYILPVARVISIYLIVVLLSLFIRVLQLPIEIWSWILIVIRTLKPFLITIIFYKLADVVAAYFTKLATKTESTLDDQLVPLMRKTLKAFVIIVGTLFILKDGLNLDIIPFLTGLSIGGVAIALAAQDTIKNFFGSVMIFIDKPFQVGDWITSGEIDGTVEEVGFRSTRIRTFRNSLMYVPNGKIADSILDNHGLRQYRRFYTTLTITYDTPPELIDEFVKGLREIVLAHPHTRKDMFHIYFNQLSSFSQDIMFYIFFEVPSWGEELQCRHEILVQIVKLANSIGVRFAFPTQTIHMESFPEKKTLVPEYTGGYEAKVNDFVNRELKRKND
ncbi:MscS family membrane protein [Algoriphagus ratkowskyi]|uniref:Mechanosensitive ion channel family protein n=1 Tax=Algoriphagus ratkowskyi TaxID=57028 RepID=A0A2W7QQT0_9BACT|nr:mechanosensitive ion channel family protein [Algoriphagus ratkowskyi]PZX50694.1 MscS family membrane protein [Algoriphagus ratkowskyi]TXD75814.1 mechanosensitive ion channel family protein [Algoriphagus ratkowskyi]